MPDPSAPVPIPLPPEPPRDRVIEALDADGTVVERWTSDGLFWVGSGPHKFAGDWLFDDVLAYARVRNRTLRHAPAEERP